MFSGFKSIVHALKLLSQNRVLWAYCALPSLAALFLSAIGVWAALGWGEWAVLALWQEPEPGFMHGVWRVCTGILQGFSVILTLCITPYLVMLVGLPLCEPLSNEVDRCLGHREITVSFWVSLRDSAKAAIGMTSIALLGSGLLFMLGLIPALGVFTTPFALLVWTPGFLAFDLVDSALGRRGFMFGDKVQVAKANRFNLLSLGWMGNLLVALPLVNLVGLPIAVVAGVCWVHDQIEPLPPKKV